jgi:cytochrome P450
MWVAASAAAVGAVLSASSCRVRPPAEPVPAALVGSAAGEIFQRLVRMNDGSAHAAMKAPVSATLEALDFGRVTTVSRERAHALVSDLAPHADPTRLASFAFRITADVIATMLGAPADALPQIAGWTDDFVRGLAPGSSGDQLERGKAAAGELMRYGRSLRSGSGLVATLARCAPDNVDAAVANAIGFLSQSYEGTAGLIGNTLVALARHPDLRQAVPAVVLEVLRHDPPVQNTRRFVVHDAPVGGVDLRAGDAVLVVLAAANRDPDVNPDPARFDVTRASPRVFTFGLGGHACPGAILATTIAAAAVQTLIASGLKLDGLDATVRYRPSINTRIPLFGGSV